MKSLYNKGFDKNDILNLYKILDWLMILPKELDLTFHEQLLKIEEEYKMEYITTAERIGIAKGIQEGIHKGRQKGRLEGIQKGEIKGKIELWGNLLKKDSLPAELAEEARHNLAELNIRLRQLSYS